MNKKRVNENRIPIVEKLYKDNQESYNGAGGFDVNDDDFEEMRERVADAAQKKRDRPFENLPLPDCCLECSGHLYDSFLWEKFNYAVCDKCRDDKGKHKLIARTEAKKEFLLKDCDFDLRRPILRYIAKKNPHNPRYGDMKLYLKLQVEEKALELFGSWEELDAARNQKTKNREVATEKRFERKIRQMRKEICGGPQLKLSSNEKHEHEFGIEKHDAKANVFMRECKTCGFLSTYEKM